MNIRAEVWRFGIRWPDQSFDSFADAASAAWWACEENTAFYERAWNVTTGEEWDRKRLLRTGDPNNDEEVT